MTDQRDQIEAVARLLYREPLCIDKRVSWPCICRLFPSTVDTERGYCEHAHAAAEQLVSRGLVLAEGREEAPRTFEDGLRAVLMIRCMKHYAVAQQNTNETTGAECGGCIAAERDALKETVAGLNLTLRKYSVGLAAPLPTPAPQEPSDEAIEAAFYAIYGRKGGPPTNERDGPELAAVENALVAAYAVDRLPTPAGSEENERND